MGRESVGYVVGLMACALTVSWRKGLRFPDLRFQGMSRNVLMFKGDELS